jgi:hypothetical protein
MCQEKKVLYKLISGLHSSISIHIAVDYLLDESTNKVFFLPCPINTAVIPVLNVLNIITYEILGIGHTASLFNTVFFVLEGPF